MKTDLKQKFNVDAETLYDKPQECYGPITTEESHNLFLKLGEKYPEFLPKHQNIKNDSNTAFTSVDSKKQYIWNKQRPAILISSTSWTEDEDFGILLEALLEYEQAATQVSSHQLPDLLCVITGKGPQKEHYCNRIANEVRNISTVVIYRQIIDVSLKRLLIRRYLYFLI